jgi:hypothetical protein
MKWCRIRLFWESTFGQNRHKASAIMASLKAAMNKQSDVILSSSEKKLVSEIREETAHANRNNLTRTNAYLTFFHRHPEVHWALLAHCVSRNGGFSMTDLKGELFLRMASQEDSKHFFAFLERANWLIFHDAYAQMLLYQKSKSRNQNMSHLLSALDVSNFMGPIWESFWKTRDSSLLTRALIINEQNYIESRVVKNPFFQSTVESSIQFRMESFLNLNQVLIPYTDGSNIRLTGTTMQHFVSVEDRIQTGLRLYHALFGHEEHYAAIVRFLDTVPHSASRADYWPDVFTCEQTCSLSHPYCPRFLSKTIHHNTKIYSPKLKDVWADVEHQQAEPGDWFQNSIHVIYLFDNPSQRDFDITEKYVHSIKSIENFIVIKEKAQRILPKS